MEALGDEFDVIQFEKKLNNLKDTQDSIQTVSTWCLQNRMHHKKIVSSWLNVLKQVKIEQRLTLFHLANDVIQYSKRKHYEFVESWGTSLQKATTMVRDEKIKNKILRIFQIWEQRAIYNEEFLSDLNGLLSISNKKSTTQTIQSSTSTQKETVIDPDDFQPTVLVSNIQDCVKLETETDKNIKILAKIQNNTDLDNIKLTVKDRDHVEEVDNEISDSLITYELVIKCLNAEIKARNVLITAIEQAELYYSTQRGDVKVVANAYRNFGNRIKNMKKKLEELQTTLPSPMPSPDINAPSPEPDNDFILPDDNNYFQHQTSMSNMMGYIGSTKLPFDINDFNSDSDSQRYEGDSVQSIQVINSRPKEDAGFDINDFFKNYLSDSYGATLPQPVPPAGSYQPNSYQPPPINNPVPPLNYQPPMENIPSYPSNHPPDYSNQPSVLPLLPPPLPPALDHNDPYNPTWDDPNMNWNSSQDSNNFDDLLDTPISPPHFEREGLNKSLVEYIDSDNLGVPGNEGDIDHRQLNIPSMEENVLSSIGQGRGVDIDHRNLIALTGSPIPKSNEESIPPPPTAPPLLWSGDMDFRHQMQMPPPPLMPTDNNEIDQDYRIPPPNMNNKVITPSNLTITKPLEPPPLHDMDEFLKPQAKDDIDSPIKNQQMGRNLKNPNMKTGMIKGQNARDNVESVDMEMSDDDNEDNQYLMMQQQHPHPFPNNNMIRSPLMNQQRPPMLNTPKYGNNQSQFQNQWENSPGGSMNNDWNGPPQQNTSPPMYHHNSPGMGPRGPPQFFSQNRPFSPQMNNFRGNMRGGSPYFRPQRGGPGGGFRGKFRGKNKRGGVGPW